MSRFPLAFLLSLVLAAVACSRAAELRKWKLEDGREVAATLTGIENGMAILLPPNGNVPVRVSTATMNPDDRAAVSRWVPAGRRAAGANAVVQRNASGWPLVVALKEEPAFIVVEQNRKARRFIYRSDHFEFSSTQRLGAEIIREFSRLFEITYEAVAALPLNLAPEPSQGYYRVVLFPTIAEYVAAGAPRESGGLFRSATGEVMAPLTNLGVEKINERWVMKSRDGNQPLIHEVSHQVMAAWLGVLPIWAAEGSAEYLAAGRYATGRLILHQSFDNMSAFLSEYKGVSGRDVDIRNPQRLMTMDHTKWSRDLAGREGLKNYYSAMLLFYYFCHMDGDGTGKGMTEYFKARMASANPYDDTADREKFLLRGRSWEALWSDMQKAFSGLRLKVF